MKLTDLLKYTISISLIYILFKDYGTNVINTVQLVNIDYILLIVLLSIIQYILSAYRWMYISKHTDLNITLKDSIKFYYISSFMNNILPGGIIGDIYRVYYHAENKKEVLKLGKSFQSVIFERLSGQIMLIAFFIFSLSIYFILNEKYLAFFYVLLPLLAVFYLIKYLFKLKLNSYLISKSYGKNFFKVFTGEVFWRHTILSFFVVASYILIYIISAKSLGISIDYFAFLVFSPLILLSMTLPVSIGGWGVREFTALLISFLLGLSASASISVAIMYGVLNLICSLPGVYFFLKLKLR